MTTSELDRDLASIKENSAVALQVIEEAARKLSDNDRVCWHCRSQLELSEQQSDEFYSDVEKRLQSHFPDMEMTAIVFGSFELWEAALPTEDWLEERLFQFRAFGEETGSCPEGWSYERSDRPNGWIPQAWADEEESQD